MISIHLFPKVWLAMTERMTSTPKFVAFDDQGTLEIFLNGGVVFKGKNKTIWINGEDVRGISIHRQKADKNFYAGLFTIGARLGMFTNWVKVEWEEKGIINQIYFSNSSMLGWSSLLGNGSHEIFDALDVKRIKIEKNKWLKNITKVAVAKLVFVFIIASLITHTVMINLERNYQANMYDVRTMLLTLHSDFYLPYKTIPFIQTLKLPFGEPIPLFSHRIPNTRGEVVSVTYDNSIDREIPLINSKDKVEIIIGEAWIGVEKVGTVKREFVSRIVALPGDKVQIIKNELFINDKTKSEFNIPVNQNFNLLRDKLNTLIDPTTISDYQFNLEKWGAGFTLVQWSTFKRGMPMDYGPIVIPANHVFILGDNRNWAVDSRYLGPIPIKQIIETIEVPINSYNTDALEKVLK